MKIQQNKLYRKKKNKTKVHHSYEGVYFRVMPENVTKVILQSSLGESNSGGRGVRTLSRMSNQTIILFMTWHFENI